LARFLNGGGLVRFGSLPTRGILHDFGSLHARGFLAVLGSLDTDGFLIDIGSLRGCSDRVLQPPLLGYSIFDSLLCTQQYVVCFTHERG
jgi:hypothetical protein